MEGAAGGGSSAGGKTPPGGTVMYSKRNSKHFCSVWRIVIDIFVVLLKTVF
jgi:hypothetical protein